MEYRSEDDLIDAELVRSIGPRKILICGISSFTLSLGSLEVCGFQKMTAFGFGCQRNHFPRKPALPESSTWSMSEMDQSVNSFWSSHS